MQRGLMPLWGPPQARAEGFSMWTNCLQPSFLTRGNQSSTFRLIFPTASDRGGGCGRKRPPQPVCSPQYKEHANWLTRAPFKCPRLKSNEQQRRLCHAEEG